MQVDNKIFLQVIEGNFSVKERDELREAALDLLCLDRIYLAPQLVTFLKTVIKTINEIERRESENK